VNETVDTFGRTWTSNSWFYSNYYFCIVCHQPIQRWHDAPENRDKQICRHRPIATGEVIKMEGKPAPADLSPAEDYVNTLAGQEVRSCHVADSKADCVIGCFKTGPTTLKLYCGGEVIAEEATLEQMAILFDDLFRQEFGGASIEDLI
jgi:hypothetical protein